MPDTKASQAGFNVSEVRPGNKPGKKPGRTTGFTLVELLLAITLISILLGLTYSGLRAATRSSERGELILAAGGELRSAHQFMRRQMNQMLPLPFALEGGNDEIRIVFLDIGLDLIAIRISTAINIPFQIIN